eukprot:SM000117S25498  [mRNA]  locus=s117:161705:163125:- [translate_table: standard]
MAASLELAASVYGSKGGVVGTRLPPLLGSRHSAGARRWTASARRRLLRATALPPEGSGEAAGSEAVQGKLVEMIRLQSGKLRVSDFVDEQSKALADIAEGAGAEYERIRGEALRGMDEAGSRVLEQMENDTRDFEAELAAARQELEAREGDLDAFERGVEQARSEGLFFKGLYRPFTAWKDRGVAEKIAIEGEAKKVAEAARTSVGAKWRKQLYGLLAFLVLLTIAEGLTVEDVQWAKLALLTIVFLLLTLQYFYSPETPPPLQGSGKREQ